MKEIYKKYYEKLNGANLSGGVSKLSSAVSTASSSYSSVQSSLSSSSWSELGAITVNNVTLPQIMDDIKLLSENVSGPLTEVVTKCTELVSKIKELENLEKELEALGDKWTYTEGGSRTQSEVNSHNSKIDELNKKIKDKETEIDGVVSAINGITLKTATTTKVDTSVPAEDKKQDVLNDGSIAAKKKAFIGDVDDPKSYTALNPNFRNMRKVMQLFDNTTGEILNDHAVLNLKPGETRVITVKLPTNTGMIQEVHRTSAGGEGKFLQGHVVKARSDIDPDPNKIDYVNYKSWSNHWPSNRSMLHTNSYDWVITATEKGTVKISQTCEYTTDVSKGGNLKAMINMTVNVA